MWSYSVIMLKNNNKDEIFGILKSFLLVELDPELGFRAYFFDQL